jgi:hypothetical protein
MPAEMRWPSCEETAARARKVDPCARPFIRKDWSEGGSLQTAHEGPGLDGFASSKARSLARSVSAVLSFRLSPFYRSLLDTVTVQEVSRAVDLLSTSGVEGTGRRSLCG